MLSIFVPDDGYTLPGRVPAFPGLYPEVKFKYRPATPAVRSEYTDAQYRDKADAGVKLVCRQVTELCVDGTDQVIRLMPETAKKLHAELFQALLFAVIGMSGPSLSDLEGN